MLHTREKTLNDSEWMHSRSEGLLKNVQEHGDKSSLTIDVSEVVPRIERPLSNVSPATGEPRQWRNASFAAATLDLLAELAKVEQSWRNAVAITGTDKQCLCKRFAAALFPTSSSPPTESPMQEDAGETRSHLLQQTKEAELAPGSVVPCFTPSKHALRVLVHDMVHTDHDKAFHTHTTCPLLELAA